MRTRPPSSFLFVVSCPSDVDRHRIAWFIIGLILMPLSGVLSQIVLLYYGVGMSVGIVLIVAFVLFQVRHSLIADRTLMCEWSSEKCPWACADCCFRPVAHMLL